MEIREVMAKKNDETPQSGHNVPDNEKQKYYRLALRAMQEVEKAKEASKAAVGAYRQVLKNAKAAGVMPEAIAYVLKCRNLDADELAQQEREICRMLALSGVWPSIQDDLFASYLPKVDLTAETTAEVAYDHGHTCGVKGENRDLNPHVPGTDQWDAWDRGWLTGQGDNVAKMPSAKRGRGRPKKETTADDPAESEAREYAAQEQTEAPPGPEIADEDRAKLFDE